MKKMTILFVGLAILSFLATSTTANMNVDRQDQENAAAATAATTTVVHIMNSLPSSSEAMNISCSSKTKDPEMKQLGSGEYYNLVVEDKILYRCYAIWRTEFQIWNAYQPRRDENRGGVFWMVKEDGFYLSWDNSIWVKKAVWETE